MLLNSPDNPWKLPLSLGGSAAPSNTWFRGSSTKTVCRSVQPFLHSTTYSVPLLYFTFFPKNCPFPLGSGPLSNTWYLWPTRVINPNGNWIGSAVFVRVPNVMLYNALSMEKKIPKVAPSPWDCVTPPEEDRATAIGNMHIKVGKDRACSSRHMLADRETDTDTQTCSLQYFVTAAAGEVYRYTTYYYVHQPTWRRVRLHGRLQ